MAIVQPQPHLSRPGSERRRSIADVEHLQDDQEAYSEHAGHANTIPAPPKALFKWVKKTINAVDLGAWEMNLDAPTLSPEAAQVSRQQQQSQRFSPDGTFSSASGAVSSSDRGTTRSYTHTNGASIFPDTVAEIVCVPVPASMATLPAHHYQRLRRPSRPHSSGVVGSSDGVGSREEARKQQIRAFIARVNRPQSIDLGSDHEDGGGEGKEESLRAKFGRSGGMRSKYSPSHQQTTFSTTPSHHHRSPLPSRPMSANTAAANKSNSTHNGQYASAAMLAMT